LSRYVNQLKNQDLLNSSLRKCLENDHFFATFYDYFHQSSPEIAALFDKTNIVQLNKMMENSLFRIIAVSESNWDSEQDLIRIAKAHKDFNIKPEYYKFWELSLLATVAEFDPDFNDQTRNAWKDSLSRGIELMLKQ